VAAPRLLPRAWLSRQLAGLGGKVIELMSASLWARL
jgi:hypothetical protein